MIIDVYRIDSHATSASHPYRARLLANGCDSFPLRTKRGTIRKFRSREQAIAAARIEATERHGISAAALGVLL
jgi:hypothetical protein